MNDLIALLNDNNAPTYGECGRLQFAAVVGFGYEGCMYTSPDGSFFSETQGAQGGTEFGGSFEGGVMKSNAQNGRDLAGYSACGTIGGGALVVGSAIACFGLDDNFNYNNNVTVYMSAGAGCDCSGIVPVALTFSGNHTMVQKIPGPAAKVVSIHNSAQNGIVHIITLGLW
jgi:hypothetical protein